MMRTLFLAAAIATASTVSWAQTLPDYVGSDTCVACHQDETAAWSGSHHALAWTAPAAENIVADFDGTEFAHDGTLTRFRIASDGTHYAEVTEKNGVTTEYQVHSVVGIEPLQQYLLETEEGRQQSFDVVWDVEQKRWYHLYPDQDLPPDDGLHWSGPYKNWNARCAECHATGYEKNYDAATRTYASTQAEIGVGCEACHGPGEAHLAWADGLEIANSWTGVDDYGFTMSFDDTEATIQQCATCHARREANGNGNPLPGTPFHDAYRLSTLRPGMYHADGQILDEVYVYGSFLQSKMYARGVGCLDCHDAHTAERIAEGNAVCTQCHSEAGNDRFPSLRLADYDTPAHHFHEVGSDGAQCKSCHMIERTYMGIDGRRDHSFRIPRPDLSAETASPNACTDCHRDQTPSWAAARIAEWYPDSIHRGPHYGQVLARGRINPQVAGGDLTALALDRDQPGIVRATALYLLEGAPTPLVAERVSPLLTDPDPLVRAGAASLQRAAPPQAQVTRLIAAMEDEVSLVRLAAVRALLGAPIARLPANMEEVRTAAMAEWQQGLSNRFDFPETHLVLGGMALTLRNIGAATRAFREAVNLDPQRVDAWSMLVRLAAATEGETAARAVLRDALESNPSDPQLQQFLQELNGN